MATRHRTLMDKNDVGGCDVAYLCFLFTAMVILWTFTWANPSADTTCSDGCGSAWVFVLFVVYPLFLVTFITTVTGVCLSFTLWRHWPLALLSVLVVLSFAMWWYRAAPEATWAVALTFTLASIVSTLLWFFVDRRHASSRGSLFYIQPNDRD